MKDNKGESPKKDNRFGIFGRAAFLRILLLLGCSVAILALVPRADHQSYSYDLNQPWKYPLLTAEFDTPVLRDSASVRQMKDSIDANFIPFIKRDEAASEGIVARFSHSISGDVTPHEALMLTDLLKEVYARGLVTPDLYGLIHKGNNTKVRRLREQADASGASIETVEGGGMLSAKEAFDHIDSVFASHTGKGRHQLPSHVARALSVSLVPDVTIDTLTDSKYRGQEYLNVNAALGVIKKGQRIVDRGEIINAQIFTNLNTYQEMLQSQHDDSSRNYYIAGQALYILICFCILYLFLYLYRPKFFGNLRNMTFIMVYITLFVILATLMFEYIPTGIYLVPFAAVPVVVMVFFDSRTAIFSLITAVLLATLVATFQFQFIFLELTAGLAATFSITKLSRRSQLLRTALITLAVYIVCYFALMLIETGDLSHVSPRTLLMFVFNSVVLSFAYILILIVEKAFGYTSMVTLVELSDINNPLLRRLAEEAPGTFQHSMQVSTLAAEGARAIGANTQLVRTGALYHDIGKMESPVFFTENQHGVNPHAGLAPSTSARKIISHVTDGLRLASQAKLPEVIKDFITQHHGRGMAKYFYNTEVNNNPDAEVDPAPFTYPGPNPQSKETAILMMADSVEAASRSLKEYSQAEIDALVDRIIDAQIADGLFKESPLSFADVEEIKRTFKKRLATIYHTRIAYPTINKK